MFSALRQGATVYILDKGDVPSLKIGLVEGVTQPRFNPSTGFGTTIVDIAVKVDNERKDFVGIPSNASIHGYGNIVISESKELMVSEIEGMLQSSKSIIDNIDYHKSTMKACEDMLKQLSPSYAKELERDETIDGLKDEVGSLKKDVSKILELLTKAETSKAS